MTTATEKKTVRLRMSPSTGKRRSIGDTFGNWMREAGHFAFGNKVDDAETATAQHRAFCDKLVSLLPDTDDYSRYREQAKSDPDSFRKSALSQYDNWREWFGERVKAKNAPIAALDALIPPAPSADGFSENPLEETGNDFDADLAEWQKARDEANADSDETDGESADSEDAEDAEDAEDENADEKHAA